MLERFHNFSMVCAIVLAGIFWGSLIWSLRRTRDGSVPVHLMVLCELPAVMYIWAATAFLWPPEQKPSPYVGFTLGIYLTTGALALYRFFSYTRKNEYHHRRALLEGVSQVIEALDAAQLQVMSNLERAKYLKNTKPDPTQRRSRYGREPII